MLTGGQSLQLHNSTSPPAGYSQGIRLPPLSGATAAHLHDGNEIHDKNGLASDTGIVQGNCVCN